MDATYTGTLKAALRASQPYLTTGTHRREHCSADPVKLADIGRGDRQQVRVEGPSGTIGLSTVYAHDEPSDAAVVRMGQAGRDRFGLAVDDAVTIHARCVHPTFDEAAGKAQSEFIERRSDDGIADDLIVVAPHGGDIEPYTDEQATETYNQLIAVSKSVSAWCCKGWWELPDGTDAPDHWHITSTDIHEASFPQLQCVLTDPPRFDYAVSYHGCGECAWDGTNRKVIIGGLADHDAVKVKLLTAIRTIGGISTNPAEEIVIATSGGLAAQEETNLTNRLAKGNQGVQIEQSLEVRKSHWQEIATAVASVFSDLI
jgi:phage replication-related protein YjqB (UPF0714/DUF867 family)